MYPKVAQYLGPVHSFAKFCCTYPMSLTDTTVSPYYVAYCTLLLFIPLYTSLRTFQTYWLQFRDVVLFTFCLSHLLRYATIFVVSYIPFFLRDTYRTLFKRLEEVEELIHTLNIKQTENPKMAKQCMWIFLTLCVFAVNYVSISLIRGRKLLSIFSYQLLYMFVFACYLHFLTILLVIDNKFTTLNWHLDFLNNLSLIHI